MITMAIVIILTIVVWFSPSNDDFRTDNPLWNGAKNISSSYPVSPINSLSDLPPPPQRSTLILIPYLNFTTTELDELNSFVTQGGTLILADDYGHGNQVLEHLGLKARFSGQPLLDPLANHKNQWLPQVFRLDPDSVTTNTEILVFNHATILIDVETTDVLALSSSFSFLDRNGNQTQEEDEPAGPLPVISNHSLDHGQIILIADPSIFINSMETLKNNYNFIQNIASINTANLFMDQSHLPRSSLLQAKALLADIRSFFFTPIATLGLVILALTITLMPLWRERRR
jgi:hypothetical protein